MPRGRPPKKQEEEAKPRQQSKPATGKAAWFQTGYDAAEHELERQEMAKKEATTERAISRFWRKKGERKKVLFLDGKERFFNIREHAFTAPNSPVPKWKTCLQGTGEKCPADESGNKNYFIGFLSVIDLTSSFTYMKGPNAGKKIEKEKKLYGGKAGTISVLANKADKWGKGDLTGCVVEIFRSKGDKSPNVGDDFDLIERINLKDKAAIKKYGLEGVDLKPFDYEEILKPLPRSELLKWMETMGAANTEADEPRSYE
jgi:hypothetical protein